MAPAEEKAAFERRKRRREEHTDRGAIITTSTLSSSAQPFIPDPSRGSRTFWRSTVSNNGLSGASGASGGASRPSATTHTVRINDSPVQLVDTGNPTVTYHAKSPSHATTTVYRTVLPHQ